MSMDAWDELGIVVKPHFATPYPGSEWFTTYRERIMGQYNGDLEQFIIDLGDASSISAVISHNFNAIELLGLREAMLARDKRRIDEYENIWRKNHQIADGAPSTLLGERMSGKFLRDVKKVKDAVAASSNRTPSPEPLRMIGDHRVLAVLAGRGGSKGLPRKNVLDLGGKPLVAWSVEAAQQSRLLDRCVVSTDGEEIARAARAAGGDVPFMRPAELATDTASIIDVMIDVMDRLPESYDIIVLLQATSPFRTRQDIDDCISMLVEKGAETCVTFTEMVKPPSFAVHISDDQRMQPLEGSALLKRATGNGAALHAKRRGLRRLDRLSVPEHRVYSEDTAAVVMPHERAIDIDTALDLEIARGLLTRPGIIAP